MGGLGFALGGATGLRMAHPDRPVVAVVGDGSSIYGIQALWSAAHYGVGVLFVILSNGGYAIMDRLAERHGLPRRGPPCDVDLARSRAASATTRARIEAHDELVAALDEVVPSSPTRDRPLYSTSRSRPRTFAPA